MSLVVHKLVLSPGTSGGNGSLQQQQQPATAITATTTTNNNNNNNASSVVGAGVANYNNTTITKSLGGTTTIINAVPASPITGSDGAANGGNCSVNITPGHPHHSVLTPVSQLHPQQQQQFHYPNHTSTTSMAVTVSAHTANRLPYQYTKLVHQPSSSPTATTQGIVQQQHTVLQQIPVTTIHHNFNNAGQQQQHHQFKGPQQTAIVTQSRQVALHAYSNQRLVNPSGNGGTNSEGSSGEPPPSHPPPPKCYVSSQYMKNSSSAGGSSYNNNNNNNNNNGGGGAPSMITSVISSTPTKSPIVPNEGRKAYLPLVLQDHNYMAAFPASSAVTTSSSTTTNNPTTSAKFVNNNMIGGSGTGKLMPGTGSPVRTTPLTPNSPSHHQSSPTASVVHHHQSPSRTYSLSSKASKGGGGAMLASSLASSVTSNVITNPGSRSVVQHASKLPSSPHSATRSPKAITYSLPRQGRFATTVTSPLQQQGSGAQVIQQQQQQQHFGSPMKSSVKSGGVGTGTPNSVHRSVGVIQGGGGNKTVTTSNNFAGQGGGGSGGLSPAHLQNQRYTYRRSTSTVSSGGGVPHHSPIITSILSPATHPAPIQTTQPSQVPLAGLQQYHNNNTNNNRSYVYATSTTAFVPGANGTNNNGSVNIIPGANPNPVSADGSYNGNNNNNVLHGQANSGGVLMSSNNNVSGGGTNSNVNILINNKTSVISKVSGSNNFVTSGSSRSSPGNLIIPTGPAGGARAANTPPSITYIPSPHIPPPPGASPVSSHQAMSDLVTTSSASSTASVLATSSRKDTSMLSSQQHHLGRNNNSKGNSKRDALNKSKREEQVASNSSSSSEDEKSSSPGPSGEETETAPEGEGDDMEQEDSITRCVCDLTHDDGYMIQCDRCQVWQHVICMELSKDNIPDEYLCEACSARPVDKLKARSIQLRKRAELAQLANMMSSSDSEDNGTPGSNLPNSKNKPGSKAGSNTGLASGGKKKKVKIVSRPGGGLSRPGGGLSRPAGGLTRPGGGGLHSSAAGSKTKNTSGSAKTGGGTNNKKKVSRKASGSGGSTHVHINNNNNLCLIGDDKEKKPITKTRRRKSSSSATTANNLTSPDVFSSSSTTLSSLHSPSTLAPSSCFPLPSPTPSTGVAGTPQQQLTYSDVVRGWVEGYEAAITNHYSPELRARVHAARINGISPHLRASVQGAVLGHRCKVVHNTDQDCLEYEKKVLVAGCAVSSGTALLEYQGKYLLWSQWCSNNSATNPSKNSLTAASTTATAATINSNSGSVTNPSTNTSGTGTGGLSGDKASGERFLPFTLRYTLLQEGLSVAVDARTYGNEARFARRSCTPNAQVRHVVERGSLHLYIVATEDIEEGGEILLPLHTCNTTQPSQLPPCPATQHQAVCMHANTKRFSMDTQGKGPTNDACVAEEEEQVEKTILTPSTPTKQRISSPMSSPESSSLSPVSSPHSPLLSPKGSKSPNKMNLGSPLRSPNKGSVSPFSPSGLLNQPRRLGSPPSTAVKKDRSPDQLQQSSPERENMKCHAYNKRTLNSLPIPLHQLRNSRRSISESCSRSPRISVNTTAHRGSSSEEEEEDDEDDDDDDDDKESMHVTPKTPEKSSKGAATTRRSSDEGPGGSFGPGQHHPSSLLKKRTISVDARNSSSRKNCDGSTSGTVIGAGSTVAGVTTIGPSGRLRNNSTSSSTGGTTPKSPSKSLLTRSPSDTEGGGGNESSGGGSSKENRRKNEDHKDSRKMTREEKKIAAYMKAFELLEKRSQRKQEMVKKKVEDRVKGKKSDDDDNSSGDETFRPHDKQRKKSKKSIRNNSRGQPCSFKKGSHRRRTTSGPPDDASGQYGNGSSFCPPGAMEADAPATEHGGASPIASHTRFPKTKKSMMNNWLNECVDSDSNVPSALSSSTPSSGLSCGMGVPSHYMRAVPPARRSSCAAIAGLSSASPGGGGGAAVASAGGVGGVSAKKRWLRQAISEEPMTTTTTVTAAGSTSPGHAPDSPPGGDYTTPLKKRRLARESVSGDNSNSCDTAQAAVVTTTATTTQEMAAPVTCPDAEIKMELDDDMKVKKEEGDLKYEAAPSKASSLVVAAVATGVEAATVKTEPVIPKDEVHEGKQEEKPDTSLNCDLGEVVSAPVKELATVPTWSELGRLTRKRKRSVENLQAKVNIDPKLVVSDPNNSSCSEDSKVRNCDSSKSECVVNTDECVSVQEIGDDANVDKEIDSNRNVDTDFGDGDSDGENSKQSVITRRDRAKKNLDAERADTSNKKVYRNKKGSVKCGSSDGTDKCRKRGRPRKAGVKGVSDSEAMSSVEDKGDQGADTTRTVEGDTERTADDDTRNNNNNNETDIVVDDDDSQESGFEGFSEHTSSQQGSSSEVDVEGDSEDEKQPSLRVLSPQQKGLMSVDGETTGLACTSNNIFNDKSKDGSCRETTAYSCKDINAIEDGDIDCEVQISDSTPDEILGNNTSQTNKDNRFSDKGSFGNSVNVVKSPVADDSNPGQSVEEEAEWRGAGPRTPEGPAPSSPERRACPRTPSDTPPASPTPPSPVSSPPPPPPPDSPPSSPPPPPPPECPPPPRSPLPSILQDDGTSPSITTLGRPSLTTLGCTVARDLSSSNCVSGGSPFGTTITTLGVGPSLTTLGASVTSLATDNSQHHVSLPEPGEAHSRPPLTTLGSHEGVLPLTTLGSLDDTDLSLGSLRSKYALGGEDTAAKKVSEVPGLYDQLAANQSKIPMPVKRKLSILEYRKRKSVNSESDASNSPSNGSSGSTAASNISSTSTLVGDYTANTSVNTRQTYEAMDSESFPTLSSVASRARSSSVESNDSDRSQARLTSTDYTIKGSRTSCSPSLANVFSRSPSPAMSPLATISSSTACYLSQSGVGGERLLSEASKAALLSADTDDDDDTREEEEEEVVEEEELEEGELTAEQDDDEEEVAMSCGLSPSGSPPSPPSPGTPPGTPPSPRQASTPPPPQPPTQVHSPNSPPSPTSSHSPFSSPPPFSSPVNVRHGDYSGTADLAEDVNTYRGTLTDRLKREFGLNVSEEDSDSTNVAAIAIGGSSSTLVTTDVSVPPPPIPSIQRNASGAPLPVPPPAVQLQNPSLSAAAVGFPAPDSLPTQPSTINTEAPFPKKFKTDNPNNFSEQRYYSSLPPR